VTRYVHLACTGHLTLIHTGDRSAEAIDADGMLPGYTGIIVRDGYSGYGQLTDALHAWCGAHLLGDLKALYDFEPGNWAGRHRGRPTSGMWRSCGAPRGARTTPSRRSRSRDPWNGGGVRLGSLHFMSAAAACYVVGDPGVGEHGNLMRTTNAGQTWYPARF